jgi:hypothetical protein
LLRQTGLEFTQGNSPGACSTGPIRKPQTTRPVSIAFGRI